MDSTSNLAVGAKAFVITPHASTNFTRRARAFYVGTAGDVTIVNADGTTCLLKAVPAGSLIPAECIRINAVGTTANDLVGFV